MRVELYHRLRDELRREFERLVDEYLDKNKIDERVIASMVKAIVGKEIAKVRAEVEERLSRLGVDPGLVEKIANEVSNRLLSELDKRFIHIAQIIEEKSNDVKDVLDLVNEVIKLELIFEEEFEKLRNMLSEEHLEELFYTMLVRKGIIRGKRRRWTPLIAGLGVLIAIVVGLLVNPIATLVILFIVFAILLRW